MPMCTGTCCAKQTANRILRNERTVFATFWALKSGSAGSMAPATASSSASSRSPGAASLDSAHTVFDSACDGVHNSRLPRLTVRFVCTTLTLRKTLYIESKSHPDRSVSSRTSLALAKPRL